MIIENQWNNEIQNDTIITIRIFYKSLSLVFENLYVYKTIINSVDNIFSQIL